MGQMYRCVLRQYFDVNLILWVKHASMLNDN